MKRDQGYTLIEVAIVTMIVALLIAGVMRGQEMVVQARTKSLISDFTGITGAVLAYQDRYRALPGDDHGAAGRWGAYNARSGDGDGVVDGLYNATPPTGDPAAADNLSESLKFWWHMRLAGFVSGPLRGEGAANPPINAVGGILGVQTGEGPTDFFGGLMACVSNVPDRAAIGLEAQLDDLEPNQGQVRSLLQAGPGNPSLTGPGVSEPTKYVDTGTNLYLVCRSF